MSRRLLGFALVAATLLSGCGGLDGCGDDFEAEQPLLPGREADAAPASSSDVRAGSAVDREAVEMQRRSATAAAVEVDERVFGGVDPGLGRRAVGVARRFLRGYLAYSYGRARVGALAGATLRLRRELARRPPRVPPEVARLRPRLERVSVNGGGGERVFVLAGVRDGRERYALTLTLVRAGGGLAVEEVR